MGEQRKWALPVVVVLAVALVITVALLSVQTSRLGSAKRALATAQQNLSETTSTLADTQSRLSDTQSQLSSTQSDLQSAQGFGAACKSAWEAGKVAFSDEVKVSQDNSIGDFANASFWLDQINAVLNQVQSDIRACNSG